MATQRYQTIMKDEDRYYSKNCPVCLSSYAILYDHKEKKYIAQLKLKNCSSKTIDSVRLNLRAYNQFGELSEELNNCEYTAVNASSGSEFGAKSLKPLSGSASVKRLGITINNVVFTDGQEWASDEGESMEAKVDVEPLASSLSDEEIEAYRTLTNPKMQYVPFGCDPSWVCSCGELNYDSSICTACGSEKTKVFECIEKEYLRNTILKNKYEKALSNKKLGTISSLQQAIAQFEELGDYKDSRKLSDDCKHELVSVERAEEEKKQEEERQAELQRKEADEKAKKNKKVAIIAAVIAIVCIAGFLIVTKVITPNNNYNAAVKLMENGDYDAAIEAFEALGDYKDSQALIAEAQIELLYNKGVSYYEGGEYSNAIRCFSELGDFKDSKKLLSDSQAKLEEQKQKKEDEEKAATYTVALDLLNNKDYDSAYQKLSGIKGFKDVDSLLSDFYYVPYEVDYMSTYSWIYKFEYSDQGLMSRCTIEYENGDIESFAFDQDGVLSNNKDSYDNTHSYIYESGRVYETAARSNGDIFSESVYDEYGNLLIRNTMKDNLDSEREWTLDEHNNIYSQNTINTYDSESNLIEVKVDINNMHRKTAFKYRWIYNNSASENYEDIIWRNIRLVCGVEVWQ